MSKNRENVAWPATDGKWSIGFFDFYETGDPGDEDFDDEWDVEYMFDKFWWTSTGHVSADAAMEAYCRQNCNPGGGEVIPDRAAHLAECERYDAMIVELRERNRAERAAWSTFQRI